jgi:hypothetical protein
MTDKLEVSIASALSNDNASAADLIELIAAVEANAIAATQEACAARERAIDLIASPDSRAAHENIVIAELRRDRLQAVLPRLRERLSQAEAGEYCDSWRADFDKVATQRDALAKEFQEVFPATINQLLDLFQRMVRNDTECNRVNAAAPGSESRRLRSAELTARGLLNFSRDMPSLTERVQLPDINNSAALSWPPPRQSLGIVMAQSMLAAATDPRRYSDKWWEVQEEDNQARRAENERIAEFYRQSTEQQERRQNEEGRRR